MMSIRTIGLYWVLGGFLFVAGDAQASLFGACCHPNGSCTDEFDFVCQGTPGAVYQGDFTVCETISCPQPSTTTTTSTMPPTTTTTTTILPTTTTTMPPSTTTTTSLIITTTTEFATTTTTIPTGACCTNDGCYDVTMAACEDMIGGYQGDGTNCNMTEICYSCGNGCVEPGETCDDANTDDADGCVNCQQQDCWQCDESFVPTSSIPVAECYGTLGPSLCSPIESAECEPCGNGVIAFEEECDDGNTLDGDCCSSSCTLDVEDTPCNDGIFCNGADYCDGAGGCFASNVAPDCSGLDTQCSEGVCDVEVDACVADPLPDGTACEASGDCIADGSGVCLGGVCAGEGTTLSPSCRWIIVGGGLTPDPVRLRSGRHSLLDANTCSDRAKLAGKTSASHVAIESSGEAIRFYGPPEVDGDIATGGGSVAANLYLVVPGTQVKQVPGGMMAPKMPSGVVDTTGGHALVDVCLDDKALLPLAATALDGMLATPSLSVPNPLKVPVGASATIDVTGKGVAVVDLAYLKVSHGATLNLKGNASDVLMVRVTDGRLKFGYGARVALDGLVPQNVLFYSQWLQCRISPGVVGAGTVFCPGANRFKIGVGTNWTGTFLGGAREVQVRLGALLTHAPFTGF